MFQFQFDFLVEQLLQNLLREGVYDQGIFKAIAMIGPMGAGKSTIAKKLLGAMSGLRSVNLDDFNEMLLKQGKVTGGNLAPDQLERSWQLTQKRKDLLIQGRLGLLIDGSGRKIDSVLSPLREVEKLGYDTMVIAVNVSLETSLERQRSRAAAQAAQWGTGRNVPEDLARTSHADIQKNIPALQQMLGNRFILIQNEGDVNLSSAYKQVQSFLSLKPTKPQATAWIQSELAKKKRAPNQQGIAGN